MALESSPWVGLLSLEIILEKHVMKITKTHRGFGVAGLGIATFAVAAMLSGPASADATKEKLANGHWGGSYGDVWIPGPYEKKYETNPSLGTAAKAEMANGHWGGTYGDVWVPAGKDKPYNVSPQLTQGTKDKLAKGHWGGTYGTVWIPASANK